MDPVIEWNGTHHTGLSILSLPPPRLALFIIRMYCICASSSIIRTFCRPVQFVFTWDGRREHIHKQSFFAQYMEACLSQWHRSYPSRQGYPSKRLQKSEHSTSERVLSLALEKPTQCQLGDLSRRFWGFLTTRGCHIPFCHVWDLRVWCQEAPQDRCSAFRLSSSLLSLSSTIFVMWCRRWIWNIDPVLWVCKQRKGGNN